MIRSEQRSSEFHTDRPLQSSGSKRREGVRIALWINLAWSVLLFTLMLMITWAVPIGSRVTLSALAGLYAGVSAFALYGRRWAMIISTCVPAILAIYSLPMVTANLWMYYSGHELYRDSPATIFVVAIYAAVLTIPTVVLCGLMIYNRKDLWRLLSGST